MGGSSGGKAKTTVADYYMTVHYGVCTTVDRFNSITINDVLVPELMNPDGTSAGLGRMTSNGTLFCYQDELFGGYQKQGGVRGHIDYMLGHPDQGVNEELAKRVGVDPAKMPAFRGISSILFRGEFAYDGDAGIRDLLQGSLGFKWSANMPTLPPVAVNVSRFPRGPNGVTTEMPDGQANPSHIIYEALTDTDWGMGSPLGLVDIDSFVQCADTLLAENFGLSLMWARSATIENFIGEILDHIQATLTTDPASGKLKLKLLRYDYDVANLFIVHPGNATMVKMQRKVWGETINDIQVTWTNPESEGEESVNAQNNANIEIQGAVVSTSRNYYGVRNANLALELAYRDLRQSSAPLLAMEFKVNRTAWDKIVGDVVEVRWPEQGIGSAIMRIGAINYGNSEDTSITINMIEDIFGLGSTIFVDLPVNVPGMPAPTYPPLPPGQDVPPYIPPYIPVPQPNLELPIGSPPSALTNLYMDTAPYFLVAVAESDQTAQAQQYPESIGLVLVNQPDPATTAVDVWTNRPTITGDNELVQIDRMPNGGRGRLASALSATASIFTITGWVGAGVRVGQLLLIVAGESDALKQELVAVNSVTASSVTVVRGILDTNAYTWPVNTPVWGIRLDNTSLDPVVRSDGENVSYRFTPVTNQGIYPVSSAVPKTHKMSARYFQPYRPVGLAATGGPRLPITVTWRRRNRLMETAQVLPQSAQDVTPEFGQTTTLVFSGPAEGSPTRVVTGIEGTSYALTSQDVAMAVGRRLRIQAFAARDGYLSRVSQEITIDVAAQGYGAGYGMAYGV